MNNKGGTLKQILVLLSLLLLLLLVVLIPLLIVRRRGGGGSRGAEEEQKQLEQKECSSGNYSNIYEFVLSLQLDAYPSETTYELICTDGISYLNGGPFYASQQFHTIHEHLCLYLDYFDNNKKDNNSTNSTNSHRHSCLFTMYDTYGDGLTGADEEGNGGGTFNVTVNGLSLASYNGTQPQQNFTQLQYCFGGGTGCNEWEARQQEQQQQQDSVASNNNNQQYVCQNMIFTMSLDEHPDEVGYVLECDNRTIWDRQPQHLDSSWRFAIVHETKVCVNITNVCVLTVTDTYGDGLTDAGNVQTGLFALFYGSDTVAIYDGQSEYSTLSYCFGPGACPSVAAAVVAKDEGGEEAAAAADSIIVQTFVEVKLSLRLDEFPSETATRLRCGSDVLWDNPFGSYNAKMQFETITVSAIIDTTTRNTSLTTTTTTTTPQPCCTLSVLDSYGDGLTSPQERIPGMFQITWDGGTVVFHDASDPDSAFSQLEFELGECQ